MKLIGPFLILVTLFCIVACKDSNQACNDSSPTPDLVVEFYKDTLDTAGKHHIFRYSLPDTLTVNGIGRDSLLVKVEPGVQRVLLPININSQSSSYSFIISKYKPTSGKREITIDTLKIDYLTRRLFLSPECGFNFNYEIKDTAATKHRIDSLQLMQKDITNEASTALRIYFK